MVEVDGERQCATVWAERMGLKPDTVLGRMQKGKKGLALFAKPKRYRLLTINGKTRPLAQWSRISGIGESCIRARLKKGWDDEAAVFRKLMVNQW
jgi:hypothetical protein